MTYENPLLAAWARGEATFGAFAAIPSGFAAEIVADVGPDFVCIDYQHGLLGLDSVLQLIQAVGGRGVPAIVRVPTGAYGYQVIEQVLDAGAVGIIAPVVDSAEDAQRAVAACRYPPRGRRSFGPIRAGMLLRGWDLEDLSNVVCAVQIESEEGLRNVEEIVAVPGIDAVYIGPSDLAISLGQEPLAFVDRQDPLSSDELRRIKTACEAAGVTVGTACGSGESAHRHAQAGFKFLTFTGDTSVLGAGMRDGLQAARLGHSAEVTSPESLY